MDTSKVREILLSIGVPSEEIENVINTVSSIAVLRALDKHLLSAPHLRDQAKDLRLDEIANFVSAHAHEIPKITEEDLKLSAEKTWAEYIEAMNA